MRVCCGMTRCVVVEESSQTRGGIRFRRGCGLCRRGTRGRRGGGFDALRGGNATDAGAAGVGSRGGRRIDVLVLVLVVVRVSVVALKEFGFLREGGGARSCGAGGKGESGRGLGHDREVRVLVV